MLPPDQSPVHQLVSLWITCRKPQRLELPACRARLFTAATHEITAHAEAGNSYDPMSDARFRWAVQFLEVAEESRKSIDPDIQFTLEMILTPCPTSCKLAAANDA